MADWPVTVNTYASGSLCNASEYSSDFTKLASAVNNLHERFSTYSLTHEFSRQDTVDVNDVGVNRFFFLPSGIKTSPENLAYASVALDDDAFTYRNYLAVIKVPDYMQAIRVRGIHLINNSTVDNDSFCTAMGHEPDVGIGVHVLDTLRNAATQYPLKAGVCWGSALSAFTFDSFSGVTTVGTVALPDGSDQTEMRQIFPAATGGSPSDDATVSFTSLKYPNHQIDDTLNTVVMSGSYIGVWLEGGYQHSRSASLTWGAGVKNETYGWDVKVIIHYDAFAPIP